VFFVLNFTILSTIVYLLLRYFVQQKTRSRSSLRASTSWCKASSANPSSC